MSPYTWRSAGGRMLHTGRKIDWICIFHWRNTVRENNWNKRSRTERWMKKREMEKRERGGGGESWELAELQFDFQVKAFTDFHQCWERRRVKADRHLQPRIPMLSLALMWDSSSCRDKVSICRLLSHINSSSIIHTLTLSMEASLRNSIRSSLSLLWFSSSTSETHTDTQGL